MNTKEEKKSVNRAAGQDPKDRVSVQNEKKAREKLTNQRERADEIQVLPLNGLHKLVLSRSEHSQSVSIERQSGDSLFRIHLSGPDVHIEVSGEHVMVDAKHRLEISAQELSLRGERSLDLYSGENVSLTAKNDVEYKAQEHRMQATHGSVKMKSNDDISLNGERILLNS